MNRIHAARTAVTAAALLFLGAGTLRAQRALDTTLAVRGPTRLSVYNMSGNIVIHGWNRSQIRVQAESDGARVDINEGAGRVTLRTVSRNGNGEVDYTISVPVGTAVETRALSSDVQISGTCGEVQTSGVSGDVTVDCVEGGATIETISGDISLSNTRGALDLSSTSGDVTVRGARGGSVSAHAVSGDISLVQVESSDVSGTTVSGGVEYQGRVADTGRYVFEAHSGDVTLRVAGTFNATVTVNTFNGDFESDFPIEIQPGRHNISREWQFRQGNGSAHVQLKSFSGSINLRRSSGASHEE